MEFSTAEDLQMLFGLLLIQTVCVGGGEGGGWWGRGDQETERWREREID